MPLYTDKLQTDNIIPSINKLTIIITMTDTHLTANDLTGCIYKGLSSYASKGKIAELMQPAIWERDGKNVLALPASAIAAANAELQIETSSINALQAQAIYELRMLVIQNQSEIARLSARLERAENTINTMRVTFEGAHEKIQSQISASVDNIVNITRAVTVTAAAAASTPELPQPSLALAPEIQDIYSILGVMRNDLNLLNENQVAIDDNSNSISNYVREMKEAVTETSITAELAVQVAEAAKNALGDLEAKLDNYVSSTSALRNNSENISRLNDEALVQLHKLVSDSVGRLNALEKNCGDMSAIYTRLAHLESNLTPPAEMLASALTTSRVTKIKPLNFLSPA